MLENKINCNTIEFHVEKHVISVGVQIVGVQCNYCNFHLCDYNTGKPRAPPAILMTFKLSEHMITSNNCFKP